ncbi:unnamed protein product [Arctogadus glacialis]
MSRIVSGSSLQHHRAPPRLEVRPDTFGFSFSSSQNSQNVNDAFGHGDRCGPRLLRLPSLERHRLQGRIALPSPAAGIPLYFTGNTVTAASRRALGASVSLVSIAPKSVFCRN